MSEVDEKFPFANNKIYTDRQGYVILNEGGSARMLQRVVMGVDPGDKRQVHQAASSQSSGAG